MVMHMPSGDPEVGRFVYFVMGEEGQQVMRDVGTAPCADAIHLWLRYLDQQNRAIATMHARDDAGTKNLLTGVLVRRWAAVLRFAAFTPAAGGALQNRRVAQW